MSQVNEIRSAPVTPSRERESNMSKMLPVTCPPSPLLMSSPQHPSSVSLKSTKSTPPITSPIRQDLGDTKLSPDPDAWLPITESRNGNSYYAAFHTLCSGIGFQALSLPIAFLNLGWTWGIISLTVAFIWQLYTLWLLVQLHEPSETGIRYSRYYQLFRAAYDNKLGRLLAGFSVMFQSGGTCLSLLALGGSTLKYFFHEICHVQALTAAEWYLLFTCMAVLLSQLPNLNSTAGVSLVGAVTAVGYCTVIWVRSVAKVPIQNGSYDPADKAATTAGGEYDVHGILGVLNAFGIIVFAFRGHNLILEIQGTLPSSEKQPSRVPMWKGVKVAYTLIAMCLFPLAIGGFWAYGHKIPKKGMLAALYKFHTQDMSRIVVGVVCLFVIVNALTSYQIYAMPAFDDIESKYTSWKKRPCPWWLRSLFRILFGYLTFFMAVALPVSDGISSLLGAVTLPITMAFPCFMWLKIKKPRKQSKMWWLNWGLGMLGLGLSGLLVAAGVCEVIETGVKGMSFKPQ